MWKSWYLIVIFLGNNYKLLGKCIEGKCICDEGYTGNYCSEKICRQNCSFNGQCHDGICYCNRGWTGENCERKDCLNSCSHKYLQLIFNNWYLMN